MTVSLKPVSQGFGAVWHGLRDDLDLMGVLVDQNNLSVDNLEDDLVDVEWASDAVALG